MKRILAAAGRAAAWRGFEARLLDPQVAHVVALAVLLVLSGVAYDWIDTRGKGSFDPDGINAAVAVEAVSIAVLALAAARGTKLRTVAVGQGLFVIGALAMIAASADWPWLPARLPDGSRSDPDGAVTVWTEAIATFGVLAWMTGALMRVFLASEGAGSRPGLKASACVICIVVVTFVLPPTPIFAGKITGTKFTNLWDLIRSKHSGQAAGSGKPIPPAARLAGPDRHSPDPATLAAEDRGAATLFAQPGHLARELAGLAPRRPGGGNLFVIGVAGSEEGVFLRETLFTLELLDQRFGTGSRTARLVNYPAHDAYAPMASLQNLAAVLRGVAARMDRDEDGLVLFVSTKAAEGGRGLELSRRGLVRESLSPASLRRVLDEAGIRNRIVLLSGCGSGAFVPALADDDTVVVSAAAVATSASGCSSEARWTTFGDAFVNHGLRREGTIRAAFAWARDSVAASEAKASVPPSEPQLHVGQTIARRFPALVGGRNPSGVLRRASL